MKTYPILRLAIPLATGIFFAEYFHALIPLEGILAILAVLFVVLGVLLFIGRYDSRWMFGMGVMSFMLLTGYFLMEQQWKQVNVEWPSEKKVYKGMVLEMPVEKTRSIQYRVQVNGRDVLLYLSKDSLAESIAIGDSLLFYTSVSKPENRNESMGFDYATYLLHKGISGTAYAAPGFWNKLDGHADLTLKQKALILREEIVEIYRGWGMTETQLPVLSALTIGHKADLDAELREHYSIAGISHVLALSGLHVGIIWMFLAFLLEPLRRIRWGNWLKWILATGLLWSFSFVAGLEASVVRAVIMCMLMELGMLVGNKGLSMNVLAIAAFFMLLYNPFYLFDVGFQLSYIAVISILLFYPYFSRLVYTRWRLLGWVKNTLAVSVSAQIGTAPLVMYYFSNFSLYFLLANVVAAVLVPLIVGLGLLTLMLIPIPILSERMSVVLGKLVDCLNLAAAEISGWPYAQLAYTDVSGLELGAVYLLLLSVWLYWKSPSRKKFIGILSSIVGVLLAHLLA